MRIEMKFEELPARVREVPQGSFLTSVKVIGPRGGLSRDYELWTRELLLGPLLVQDWDPWVDASELSADGFLSRHIEAVGDSRAISYGSRTRIVLHPSQDLVCTFQTEVPDAG